jgi:hypothetical protein
MKKIYRYLLLSGLSLCVIGSASAAFSPAIVGADASWVVYADMNALRDSVVGKQLIDMAQKLQLQATSNVVAIDIPKLLATVGSVTAYGANMSPDPKMIDGALVVQGTPDLRKIAESLLLQATLASPKDVSEVTDLPFPAYALTSHPNPANSGPATELVVAFPPEPIVLVSKSRAQLLMAREVFRGRAGSLAKAPASPLTKLLGGAPNAFLLVASVVPSGKLFPDDAPQARILQMVDSASLALGENGPNVFAHAELHASSPAMAEKLMKILQGLTAMLSLAETTDKQLTEFLNSTKVAESGNIVTLDLAYSSARLVQMVQNLQQPKSPQPRPTPRAPLITSGKVAAEWHAEAAADGTSEMAPASRTIEAVSLKNGTVITLGRQSNGGKDIRFDRIEISPTDGAGAPLVFRPEFMKALGSRGNMVQFQFPGADGNYTLKVAYLNDPDGKATYAVSLKDPAPAPVESDAKSN